VTLFRNPGFVLAVAIGLVAPAVGFAPAAVDGSGLAQAATASAPVKPKPKPKKKKPRYVFTFEGRGFGHGVGMSQYGAYGAAKAGKSAQEIIGLYYQGTSLTVLPVTPVRVLLRTSASSVTLRADGAWGVYAEGTPLEVVRPLPPNVDVTVTRSGSAVLVSDPEGAELLKAEGPIRFAPTAPQTTTTTFKGTRYRGQMRVLPEGETFTVVNHVDLEQYLPGVVPREMPPSWGNTAPAALEAQAIAARSYAMATKRSGAVFDMYADERSQVYGGASSEDPRADRAVAATAGKVVTLDGRIVTTFFFSTSGGKTENVENIFRGSPRSYLVSVDDEAFDAGSPHHVWRDPKTYTDAELGKLVGLPRPVLKIQVLERGVSPRVKLVRFTARNGVTRDMRGTELRSLLGLRDSWFYPRRKVKTPATLRLARATAARAAERAGEPAPVN
jgi:stage II sporulation protein D